MGDLNKQIARIRRKILDKQWFEYVFLDHSLGGSFLYLYAMQIFSYTAVVRASEGKCKKKISLIFSRQFKNNSMIYEHQWYAVL